MKISEGVKLIAAERERQISEEGWTPEHDDQHDGNQLVMAAVTYASPVQLKAKITVACGCRSTGECPHLFGKSAWVETWPWDGKWLKTKNRVRDLVKAGALIAAEIDRLKRAEGVPVVDVPKVGDNAIRDAARREAHDDLVKAEYDEGGYSMNPKGEQG